MLGLYMPYKWHANLPKVTDKDQLFSPLLHSSSGKARWTALYVQEPRGLLFRRGLIPEEGQCLCRTVCLALSFCPCYCGQCVWTCEQHPEAPDFIQTSDYVAGSWPPLFFWHLASFSVHRLKCERCAQSFCVSTLAARSVSPAQHVDWVAQVFLEFGCYTRCLCIRKSHDFSTSLSLQYLHCFSVKYNTESKREDRQGSCSWFICDLFIKMNLFKSFKIYSHNYPRSLLCANCIWENRPSQIKTLADFSSTFKSVCAKSIQWVYMG